MIERAVVQFSFISIQLDKCGQNEPTIESIKLVNNISIDFELNRFEFF